MNEYDYYGWYMDRLTGAGVSMVVGGLLFLIGMAKGMDHLIVETQGEWMRMDIVGPNAFIGYLLVGVLGMMLFSYGGQVAWLAKQRYDYATRGQSV